MQDGGGTGMMLFLWLRDGIAGWYRLKEVWHDDEPGRRQVHF